MTFSRRITWTWLAQVQETRHSLVPFLYQTRTLTTSPRFLRLQSQPYSQYSPFESAKTGAENDSSSGPTHENNFNLPSEPVPAIRTSFIKKKAASVAARRKARKGLAADPTNKSVEQYLRPVVKVEPLATTIEPKMTTDETRTLASLFQQLEEDTGVDAKSVMEGDYLDYDGVSMADRNPMQEIYSIFDAAMQDANMRLNNSGVSEGPTSEAKIHSQTEIMDAVEPGNTSSSLHSDSEGFERPGMSKEYKEFEKFEGFEDSGGLEVEAPSHRKGKGKFNLKLLKETINREGLKIESALCRAAEDKQQGEIRIWKICKESIFSMIQHLEPDGNREATSSMLDELEFPGRRELGDQSKTDTTPILDVPPFIPIEAVVTELYPRMLLSTFRLLNLHFPQSSLIAQFRSTINSLGRESAVLGSSMELYNELIYFYWRGRHDIPEVLSVLREMEVLGLSPNKLTLLLLKSISAQRKKDLESLKLSDAGRLWWDLPQNRKAMRDLDGEGGWIEQVREQLEFQTRRERERSRTLWGQV
ncbi:hypothetical protein BJX68DRAFT_76378 [Aspergillus pseudodeflectus]|uniref:Mtf2-like C-terminal domain-containing protein n=1 Tax=Aspergillus pseudodeflectus TaxID=176178 RepID=A0ABR4KFB2_9EURO